MIKHIHGRFGFDDKETDDCAEGNENISEFLRGDYFSEIVTGGHKANICACEEKNKAYVSVNKTDQNLAETSA